MTTPKQKRLQGEKPDDHAPLSPVLDDQFDDLDQAEQEFTQTRRLIPSRRNGGEGNQV